MYPKHFFERFWEGEQKNQLFVGIAFNDSVNSRFDIIDKSAKSIGFEKAFRVGVETEANSISDRIFDGIANSKMLLFDLSDDPRTNSVNLNVMYELGIANAIREPFDIVLIRKKTDGELRLPFDIRGLHVNEFSDEITEEFIEKIVKSALSNQEWHKSKRVKMAAQSVDDIGLGLMCEFGWKPEHSNFHTGGLNTLQKMSVLRLMDLGILQFSWDVRLEKKWIETSYWWTSFGREVMKFMGIKQMPLEEYRKTEQYKRDVEASEKFYENKQKHLGSGTVQKLKPAF